MGPNDNLCMIFNKEQKEDEIVVNFILDGIKENHRVVFICSDHRDDEYFHRGLIQGNILLLLESAGLDIRKYTRSGQLKVVKTEEILLSKGLVDAEKAYKNLKEACDLCARDGYLGLRITADRCWALQGPATHGFFSFSEHTRDGLVFESRLNELCDKYPLIGLCMYDQRLRVEDPLPLCLFRHSVPVERSRDSLFVLIVEDNITNQMVLQRLLMKLGCSSCDVASNGEIGVEFCKAKDYDLIFMDISLPGIDGLATTRLIQELYRARNRKPVIAAVTASVTDEIRRECLEKLHMDAFITKPLILHTLKKVLDTVLIPLLDRPYTL